MSLTSKVVNKDTGESLQNHIILQDDTVEIIKEKLFASYKGLGYVPSLTSVEIDQTSVTVYVSNILSQIDKLYDIDELFNDQDKFELAYNQLAQTFTDLQEQDLEFVVKLAKLKVQPDEKLKQVVNSYIETIFSQQSKLVQKYTKLHEELHDYFKLAQTFTNFSEYLGDPTQFEVFNVVVNIRGNSYEPGAKGRYIKLMQIFNTLELTDDIALIAIADPTGGPMIKANNKIVSQTTKKEIKSWFLNEKKKTNTLTYKKIRGLLMKFRYGANDFITLNLNEDGQITAKINTVQKQVTSFDPVLKIFKNSVDHIVTVLNSMNGIFRQPKRIESFDQSVVQIESISATISTSKLFNRDHLEDIMSNLTISENIFELKDTMSDEVLSILYKRGKSQGITVNIRDDPYKINSSRLTIFGTDSIQQLVIIAKQLVVLDILNNNTNTNTRQKIRERSHIKDLRKQGVETSSKKCQKDRQPSIVSGNGSKTSTYTLQFNNIKYVCPAKDYPYPGFTNDNIVCCFKKDQRNKPVYIRNTNASDYDIIVQPSNYKVTITTPDKKTLITYAIKVLSSYRDGFDSSNSMPRYYYISSDNQLIAITNDTLTKKLEELDDTNWLEEIPLAAITTDSPKNKCNFPPNMSNKFDDDTNAPCSHHDKNKIFAYNLNSYPCCFSKEPDTRLLSKRRRDRDGLLSKHIFTSDKILEHKRIGLLPEILDNVFNKLIRGDPEYKFYRMGVHQNTSSFLSAILLAFNENSNFKDFRKSISEYLQNNPVVYTQLNAGNINLKYGKLENYLNYLLDLNENIYWEDVLDVVQRVTRTNIVIIDIPYNNREPIYNETKIVCNKFYKLDQSSPCIILIKRQTIFELVFKMKQSDPQTTIYQFTYDADSGIRDNIVNFLVDYQTHSCVKQSNFPDDYKYKELYNIEEIVALLSGTPHQIISQIMNKFKRVNYVMTKRGILIPIKETGAMDSLKIVTLGQLRTRDKLWDLATYIRGIAELNLIIPTRIELIGITTNTIDGTQKCTAALTNFGQFVPLKLTTIPQPNNFAILPYKYYEDVDDHLAKQLTGLDSQGEYNKRIQEQKTEIYEIKTKLGDILSKNESLKEQITEINKSVTLTRHQKIQQLINIFVQIIGPQQSDINVILQHIANEVLNDNVENLLLNNIVISDVFDPNTISRRETESVLMNIADMERWFSNYEQK